MIYNTHTSEESLLEKELIVSLSKFITLRWVIVIGICVTTVFTRIVLKINVPLAPILIIAFCILVFNVVCICLQKRVKSYEDFASLQISVDWTALVFIVHYTGGIESPVIFYFVFHVILSAILLSRKACYLQTSFALSLIISLSMLEYFHIIPHVQIKELFPNTVCDSGSYLLTVIFFCITSLYVSAYLATSVVNRLRKRENEVVDLNNIIAEAYNKLEAIDREKSEFTFKVIHELRSPLGAVQSLLKSIEDGYAGEISQKARDLIVRSERRTGFLLTLVNDLLDLVTGKIGKPREGDRGPVDITVAVKDVLQLFQEKTKAKNIKIAIKTTGKIHYINIVRDDLGIILTNLIDNAVKYTKEGGVIDISNIVRNKEIIVVISDTGIGIIKEDLDKIFNEFYRSKNAKDIEGDGTGLGLPIVRNLMKRYSGSIEVQSIFGKGTTVTISFPV